MIRPICKDPMLLAQKASPATAADAAVAADLAETLSAHRSECVGMAANMIGVPKSIIAIAPLGMVQVMINPVILRKSGPYETEEGCLSLPGTRKTTRYQKLTLRWQDTSFRYHEAEFTAFTAQIIQHEIDHLSGILI